MIQLLEDRRLRFYKHVTSFTVLIWLENEKHIWIDPIIAMSPVPYFCICFELALILTEELEKFERRKFDNSVIIPSISIHQSTWQETKKIHILHPECPGGEDRGILKCKRCGLDIAYEVESSKDFLYILPDGLQLLSS